MTERGESDLSTYDAALRSFCGDLRRLRIEVGGPTLEALAAIRSPSGFTMPGISAISNILNGKIRRPPEWEFVTAYVAACRRAAAKRGRHPLVSTEELHWRARHELLQSAYSQQQSGRRGSHPKRQDNANGSIINDLALSARLQAIYNLITDTGAGSGSSSRMYELSQDGRNPVITFSARDMEPWLRLLSANRFVVLVGPPGSGKTTLLLETAAASATRLLSTEPSEGLTCPLPIYKASPRTGQALEVGPPLEALLQPPPATSPDAQRLLLLDDADAWPDPAGTLATVTVGLRQSATCALITVQEDSPLLPLLQSSGSPAVVLRLHPLSEADVASLAEELISRRTDKVGENRRNAHWSILRVIPKLPIFVRLAAGLPDPLELKLRPSLDALELLIDLVRVSMGGEAFHGEPLDILRTLGQATWDSLDVTPSGAKRLALRFIASPKPKIAEGGDLRPILASEDQFRYKWRHSTFASLACAVAIAEQSSIALAVTLDAQLVGNPELGQLVVWAMALSDARDAAVELLTKDAGTWRDVALERSRLLLRLAIWTAPARWSGGSREGIKNAVATLAAVEPKYLRAVDPRWLEDQKLQARLKATMDRQIELAIEAIRIAATSADMARYAAGRLERYLKDVTYNGLSIDVADALLTSSGEVEVDVGLVAETARVGILDHDCHPNTRIAAIRLCARQHKVFTADDQGRFQALVRRDDLEEGLRFEIASASAGFGNTEYLLSCLSEEERPKLRLLVSAALASRSAVAEERSRAIQVLKQLATADVGETSDTARQLVGQFVGSEPLTKPDAAPAVVAPPSPSLLASAREAANGAESERALGRLLATLPADEIVRNLVTLAEDEQAYDYTRYLAAVLLHRFEPDRREQCARILSAVVRDAHPITAGHAAGALRGLGSSMDGVIRRFRRVGEEAFFAEVAASVLARTGDARALEALAHIASKHGGFANLVPFVASALSGCRFSASESEWLHALEWAEVATRSLIDVDRS